MALEQITDDGFPGFKSVDFIGQMIVGVEPLGRYWFWSALADALSYNTLDRAQAETSPDRIVGLIASHNEALVFGERTIEPWALAPTDTATFQLQTGSVIESGCASGDTIKRLDNSVFYLTSSGQIARLNGYTPLVVSTAAIESAIRDLKWSRAFAFTYEENGHAIYYITFPDGQTFGYDVRQNAWHRRESYGMSRWRVNCMEKSNGTWYAGDYSNGRIYQLDYGSVYEGCEIMPRRIRTGVMHHDTNRVKIDGFRVVSHAGTPGNLPPNRAMPPQEYQILITGSAASGEDEVFAYAETADAPVPVAIPTSTGATLAGATATYGDGKWVAATKSGTRYRTGALTTGASWSTGTLSATNDIEFVEYGGTEWAAKERGAGGSTASQAFSGSPAAFTTASPVTYDTLGNVLTTRFQMLRYIDGYWYGSLVRSLHRSTTMAGPFNAVWDGYKNTAAGWDNNGACIIGFYDGVKVGERTYFIVEWHFNVGLQRHRIWWSPDGGVTMSEANIEYDAAYATAGYKPVQLIEVGGKVVALCDDFGVITNANGTFERVETGMPIFPATGGAQDVDQWRSRRIATDGSRVYIVGGSYMVVSLDKGLTWGDPISLPVASAKGIAISIEPADLDAGEVDDTCVPMEGGFFQIRYSNDGGENWSNWRDFEAPKAGNFLQPMVTRRLGMATHRIWELMDTSNRPQDVLAASIIVE